MVAATATKGYAAVRVSDLLALAGVSRATFYQHFADKAECFRATVEALLKGGLAELRTALAGPGSWQDRIEAVVARLVELAVDQPAACRVCLIDSYTAGPQGSEPIEHAFAVACDVAHRTLKRNPEHAAAPPDTARAVIGGLHRILYSHLYRGEEDRLPARVSELSDWITCFPPGPLSAGWRPGPQRREIAAPRRAALAADPFERVVRGFAAAVAESGYERTTINQIATKAEISQSTFYQHFEGKQDALAAALDFSGAQLRAAVLPAARRAPSWPEAVRGAIAGVCRFLAAEPEFARLRAVETYVAGPWAVSLRDRGWTEILDELLPEDAEQNAHTLAVEASSGAVYALIYDRVRAGRLGELEALVPMLSYVMLCPLLGACDAAEVAIQQ
jgi:AcrR family transcriptional regulator